MPNQNNTNLITFQNRTLRIRPSAIKTPRLMVLIHGLTGDENSMWVFVRNFPDQYWIIAPRGPYHAESADGGYSWYPRQPRSYGSQGEAYGTTTIEDLSPAAEDLVSLIDAYMGKNNIQTGQFDVIGFSQGGVLANAITILYPQRIRRTGILSSFIPAKAEAVFQDQQLKGKLFFVAHGRLDDMVKVEYAHRSVEMLEKAGAKVTFCEDDVGHKVSAHCLRELEKFFAK